jgi:hypothetical protein
MALSDITNAIELLKTFRVSLYVLAVFHSEFRVEDGQKLSIISIYRIFDWILAPDKGSAVELHHGAHLD